MHPITRINKEIEDIFIGLGYEIADGPEVEFAMYNFDKLNTPEDHPARDSQDTFYIMIILCFVHKHHLFKQE